MIDLSFTSENSPEKGALLISDPFAGDSYFTRSVVLLCDHDETGSFGFILNNYLNDDLKSLVPHFPFEDFKVGIGGPVDTESVFYIHSIGKKIEGSIPIKENLFFGGNFEQLVTLLNNDLTTHNLVRFFVGYSGWSPEQLNEEISQNGWIVSNNFESDELLNTKNEHLWQSIMKKQGGKFKLMTKYPLNPMNN